MKPEQIKVTRSLGAAMSDSDRFGWQVSYVQRQFDTRAQADAEADRLRYNPSPSEAKAMSDGRFVDAD